jgi:hypothetical protein
VAALAIALEVGFVACHPGTISDVGEADLVVTFVDSTADFASISTFVMPDTIIRIDEDGGSPEADPAVDATVLARIEAHFEALGYTRVRVDGEEPDVVVLLEAARTELDALVPAGPPGGWWGWWGYWPGWGPGWGPCCYGPGWGPGYSWIPFPVGQSVGTLTVKMLRPEAVPSSGGAIPVIWIGLVNGLLEGSTESVLDRVDGLLDQMFEQSPYL